MANPNDISINVQNQFNDTAELEAKVRDNFKIYTYLSYATFAIIPTGFLVIVTHSEPDSFGMLLLILLEIFFALGTAAALYAKKHLKRRIQEVTVHLWVFTFVFSLIFIIYVNMVLGNLKVSYQWVFKGEPVVATFIIGGRLRTMALAYFIPLHLIVLLYLIWKAKMLTGLLKEMEYKGFAALKNRTDNTTIIQQTNANNMSNLE